MFKLLQAEEDKCETENYAGDVGADGFLSDKELYAEKTRKQLEFQTGLHASLAPSSSPTGPISTPSRAPLAARPALANLVH